MRLPSVAVAPPYSLRLDAWCFCFATCCIASSVCTSADSLRAPPQLAPAQVIHATVWDEFVLAHTLGWWGKALFIRNYTLL